MSSKGLEEVTVECSAKVVSLLKVEGYSMARQDSPNVYTFRVTNYNQFYDKFINLANNVKNG
jgi:hypothetical protein